MKLLVLPLTMVGMMLVRNPRHYYRVSALAMAMTLLVACVWLVAPFALSNTFGMATMLLWLIPTAIATFAMASISRLSIGGG